MPLAAWLAGWYGLPRALLLVTGVANLLYAAYSFSLAVRPRRSMGSVGVLVVANLSLAVACGLWAAIYWGPSTVIGKIHLIGEGLFVGALAVAEWTQRERLAAPRARGGP